MWSAITKMVSFPDLIKMATMALLLKIETPNSLMCGSVFHLNMLSTIIAITKSHKNGCHDSVVKDGDLQPKQ